MKSEIELTGYVREHGRVFSDCVDAVLEDVEQRHSEMNVTNFNIEWDDGPAGSKGKYEYTVTGTIP